MERRTLMKRSLLAVGAVIAGSEAPFSTAKQLDRFTPQSGTFTWWSGMLQNSTWRYETSAAKMLMRTGVRGRIPNSGGSTALRITVHLGAVWTTVTGNEAFLGGPLSYAATKGKWDFWLGSDQVNIWFRNEGIPGGPMSQMGSSSEALGVFDGVHLYLEESPADDRVTIHAAWDGNVASASASEQAFVARGLVLSFGQEEDETSEKHVVLAPSETAARRARSHGFTSVSSRMLIAKSTDLKWDLLKSPTGEWLIP